MQERNDITSFDAILDAKYGAVGTAEREAFRKEATNYCVGQIIYDARKQEHMTQSDLAKKVGTDKTYISRIEKGGKYGRYLIIAAYFSRVSRDASIRGYVCTFGLSSRTRLNPNLS